MKPRSFIFGLIIGAVATTAAIYGLFFFTHRNVYPPGTWAHRAAKSTMKDKRAYTLPLNNPDVVSVQEASHMNPDDIVVGVLVGEKARAYPWWIVSNYHVVNDWIDRTPVYVGLCELCSGSAAFSPVIKELPGIPLTFQISGIAFGTFQMSDVQTLSQWHPFSGICLEGPLEGRKLERIPSVMTSWEVWRELQPNTEVVYASSNMRYREHGHAGREIAHPNMLRKDVNLVDNRLPTNELVYGLLGTQHGEGMAFPLRDLRKHSHIEIVHQDVPILIFLSGEYGVMAYIREWESKALTFEPAAGNSLEFRDQTGTVWDWRGKAVRGRYAGAEMKPARGYMTEWYEWVSGYPNTLIYVPNE